MYGGTLMFIECYKNNGIPYLRLVRSIRRPSKNNPDKISTNFQTYVKNELLKRTLSVSFTVYLKPVENLSAFL